MVYDKRIRYLDYREGGEKIRGGGFARLEVREGKMQMDLTVAGLRPTDSFVRDVVLLGEGRESVIGQINISEGQGKYRYSCQDLGNMGGMGVGYGELRGIRIPLGAGREISGSWSGQMPAIVVERADGRGERTEGRTEHIESKAEKAEGRAEKAEGKAEKAEGRTEKAEGRTEKNESGAVKSECRTERAEKTESRAEKAEERTTEAEESARQAETRPEGERAAGSRPGAEKREEMRAGASKTMLEDKWAQLCAIYPHIRPFRDGRDYLSIGPSDFVVFPSESYKVVNNSFLLHGYYNYRHLLLARVERKGEPCYYIGVPGNYYEREKQVAVMFGFESFECAEEPAQTGDFGYYMMRTLL